MRVRDEDRAGVHAFCVLRLLRLQQEVLNRSKLFVFGCLVRLLGFIGRQHMWVNTQMISSCPMSCISVELIKNTFSSLLSNTCNTGRAQESSSMLSILITVSILCRILHY